MDKFNVPDGSNADLTVLDSEDISPYDAAYPVVLLADGMKKRLAQAETAAERVYRAVVKQAPEIAQLQQSMRKGYRLVVDASESTLKAIEQGKIKLTAENGKTYAQLLDAKGRYSTKLPIKKEVFAKGIDPVQIANAMQMKAFQDQIETITEQISVIDHSVREVIQGQQNDRIGLYYSGVALYVEAQNVTDGDMQQALMAQSLRALSEATFQLLLTMKTDIQYLTDREYETVRGKRAELIGSRISNINQSFAFIHQATLLHAAIYCNQGELPAMLTVLEEYSRFIEGTVAKNAPLLAQCDVSDNGTENGIWKSRAKLQLDVAEIAKQLRNPEKTMYLGIVEVNE
ncbi:hypothetical protein [Caproiciproducens faecalis]|uniref:Uncharacterized protein n=1 Tax=Caproiciproducens faecalis TaxID=2820301 RepID=A0ABS7DKL3_9FIRM|nr:hypothetical protein [Caproiciproducens faecalis]MBW7571626.1 hypothetical protein [Caproiciproducens faecalis]